MMKSVEESTIKCVVQMDNLERKEKSDLFSELGIAVAEGNVEVGKVYPIFGMITSIDEAGAESNKITVVINHNIQARMSLKSTDRLNLLKEKAFETGIFVAKVLEIEPQIRVDCQAVIFGRSQAFNA